MGGIRSGIDGGASEGKQSERGYMSHSKVGSNSKGVEMVNRRKSKETTVQLVGNSLKIEIGSVAAKKLERTGEKTRGKFEREELRDHEFSIEGNLMHKERIIDRKDDSSKDKGG